LSGVDYVCLPTAPTRLNLMEHQRREPVLAAWGFTGRYFGAAHLHDQLQRNAEAERLWRHTNGVKPAEHPIDRQAVQ